MMWPWRKRPTQEQLAKHLRAIEIGVLWYSECLVHQRHDAPDELSYYTARA